MESAIGAEELSNAELERVTGGNIREGVVAAVASTLFIAAGGSVIVAAAGVWAYAAHQRGLI